MYNGTDTKFVTCKNQDVKLLSSFMYHLICGVVLIFLSISSITLNIIFLATTRYSQRKLLSDYLYYMLAVTDIVTSLLVMPIFASSLFRIAFEQKLFCTLWIIGTGSGYICGVWSAATVTTITVELYVSVVHPYYHESSMASKKVISSLLVLWVLAFLAIGIIRVSSEKLWKILKVMIAFLAIPIAISMFIMHYKTYSAIKGMGLRCKDQTLDFKLMLKSKKKLLITAIYILLTFLCCFLPVGVISVHAMFTDFGNVFIDTYVYPVVEILVLANAFFDPFVYYFRLKRIRKNIRKVICCTYNGRVDSLSSEDSSHTQKIPVEERRGSHEKIIVSMYQTSN